MQNVYKLKLSVSPDRIIIKEIPQKERDGIPSIRKSPPEPEIKDNQIEFPIGVK